MIVWFDHHRQEIETHANVFNIFRCVYYALLLLLLYHEENICCCIYMNLYLARGPIDSVHLLVAVGLRIHQAYIRRDMHHTGDCERKQAKEDVLLFTWLSIQHLLKLLMAHIIDMLVCAIYIHTHTIVKRLGKCFCRFLQYVTKTLFALSIHPSSSSSFFFSHMFILCFVFRLFYRNIVHYNSALSIVFDRYTKKCHLLCFPFSL